MASHGTVKKYIRTQALSLSNLLTQSPPLELASAPSLAHYRHTLEEKTVVREVVNDREATALQACTEDTERHYRTRLDRTRSNTFSISVSLSFPSA